MLFGFDISHHNGNGSSHVESCIRKVRELYGQSPDFCFIKATEGKTYTDPMCTINVRKAAENSLVIGLYHYARPENNSAMQEAKHFCDMYEYLASDYACSDMSLIPCLDWEGESLKHNRQWVREWCDYVYIETNVKPVVYISRSECHMHRATASGDYGLWVAAWRELERGVGNVAPWKTWAFWQFTNEPFDIDVFNGTRNQLEQYAKPIVDVEDEIKDCDCACNHCGCSMRRSDNELD